MLVGRTDRWTACPPSDATRPWSSSGHGSSRTSTCSTTWRSRWWWQGERASGRARTRGRFLELVGLSDLAARRTATLSGGQEQRVALARALAARPDVILLDEPFGALDPGLRAEMHELVVELRAAVEPTILLVTHDRHEAAVLGDTVAVLLDGRIVQHDTVAGLYTRPADLRVHHFLGGRNCVPGQVRDGVHHSALGALALPGDVPDGAGALVFRQEAAELVAVDDRSADAVGVVVGTRPLGARTEVSVETRGEVVVVEASLPAPRDGRPVGVVVPVSARHVIAPPDPARVTERVVSPR